MIGIIDYGVGNIGSIHNMLKKIGVQSEIVSQVDKVRKAKKLILPGVGAFDTAMENLEHSGLIPILRQKVFDFQTSILGICLGMQLFFNYSEEGAMPGLAWVEGEVKRFRFEDQQNLKIPHMSWNIINIKRTRPILSGLTKEARFYFVHSYHVVCKDDDDILTTTPYGCEFTSSIQRKNIIGVQFHPEKSHKFGMQLLQNFAERC